MSKVTLIELMKILELRETDEFTIGSDPQLWRVKDGKFQFEVSGRWFYGTKYNTALVDQEIRIIHRGPWKPKLGETYYVASPINESGYSRRVWWGGSKDYQCLKNLKVFGTRKEAVQDAIERQWIEY